MSNENPNLKEALTLLLTTFANTVPNSDNKKEWEDIRAQIEHILQLVDRNQVDQAVGQLLAVFSMVRPQTQNTKEWEAIREETTRIMGQGETADKMLFDFAVQLGKTNPSSSNKKEWEKIRDSALTAIKLLK